jgi:hypothetical protein
VASEASQVRIILVIAAPASGACRRGGSSTGHLAKCPALVVK